MKIEFGNYLEMSDDELRGYLKGDSTMVTVRQVRQALAGALEHTEGGKCWPIGWYNKTWNDMILIAHEALGCPGKRIVNIPRWMFNLGTKSMYKQQLKNNIEGGLYLPKLADIQCNTLYIDKKLGCVPLGVMADNITRRMGKAIAKECRYYGVHALLGPGVNIKRNPLCGRNFEYFSEDPLLAGVMGAVHDRVAGLKAGLDLEMPGDTAICRVSTPYATRIWSSSPSSSASTIARIF